jgi:hypothetical protein
MEIGINISESVLRYLKVKEKYLKGLASVLSVAQLGLQKFWIKKFMITAINEH